MPAAAVMGVAAVGSAVAGGIASSKAASAQKKAAQQAAAAQQRVTDQNVSLQKDIYGQNTQLAQDTYQQQQTDLNRGYETANTAVNTGFDTAGQDVRQGYGGAIGTMSPFASPESLMALHDMMGIARPGETAARPYDFQSQDPSYAWRFNQGQQALDRSAASRGMLLSGAQLKGSMEYGQNAASQEYGAQFNRLSGMAGNAQNAAGQVAGFQQGQGTALANLATGRGTALGNMAIGQGTALNNLGQTNLSNLSTLNTNYANTLSDLRQTGVQGTNAQNQNAAQARASGYLGIGGAIQDGIGGLASIYGNMPSMSPTAGQLMPTTPGGYGHNYGTVGGRMLTPPR